MTAIFRMTEDDRVRAVSPHRGHRVFVTWSPLRGPTQEQDFEGVLTHVGRLVSPVGYVLILGNGPGRLATVLPLAQVRSIRRAQEADHEAAVK